MPSVTSAAETKSTATAMLDALNLRAWTDHPYRVAGGTALTSQTGYFVGVSLLAGQTATGMSVIVTQAASGTAPTLIKLGLYNSTGGSLLASTANLKDDAGWTTTGEHRFPFSTAYTVTATGIYLPFLLEDGVFGTTVLNVGRTSSGLLAQASTVNSIVLAGTGGAALTDLPASFTPTAGTPPAWWVGIY